jgi:tmRNA-binding protein
MTRTEIKKLLLNRKEITKIEKKEDKGTTAIVLVSLSTIIKVR